MSKNMHGDSLKMILLYSKFKIVLTLFCRTILPQTAVFFQERLNEIKDYKTAYYKKIYIYFPACFFLLHLRNMLHLRRNRHSSRIHRPCTCLNQMGVPALTQEKWTQTPFLTQDYVQLITTHKGKIIFPSGASRAGPTLSRRW